MLQIFPSLFLFDFILTSSSEKLFSILYGSYAYENDLLEIKLL